jgi:hypothetical protein
MKFTRSLPSIGILLLNPLPKPASKLLRLMPSRHQIMFQPYGFSPLRWFTLQLKLRVYCIPLPILGSTLFFSFRRLATKRGIQRYRSSICWVHTLLRIPLISSILRLRKLYLLTIYTRTIIYRFLNYGFPQLITLRLQVSQLSFTACIDSLQFRKIKVSRRKGLNALSKKCVTQYPSFTVPGTFRRIYAHYIAFPASWARHTNDANIACDATHPTYRSTFDGNETQLHFSHRSVSSKAVWQTSLRLPSYLLPAINFNARYLNCLVSRSYSTDQSVMPRTVSNSTTSYPSMGFVPLQGITISSLQFFCSSFNVLPKTRHVFQRGQQRLPTTWLNCLV